MMNLRMARQILGLPERFDKLRLRRAYYKAMKKTHPDRVGPAGEEHAKRVNLAYEYCQTWLASDKASQADKTARKSTENKQANRPPRPPRAERRRPRAKAPAYCGHDLRPKGGAHWSGFRIPAGTTLPKGWRRASTGRHVGQAYTKQGGNAKRQWQALVDFLGGVPQPPSDSHVSDTPLRGGADDFRDKGGVLWAGKRVSEGTPLPPNWSRAGNHTKGHPGQPWTLQSGDAETLRAELFAFLNAA